jgi:urease accessory protein UreF
MRVPGVNASPPDPMARQMARLLVGSDLDELREIIERWLAEAPTERARRQYKRFGAQLIELKQALAEQPSQPTQEELELALTMMLRLAAQAPPGGG